MFFTTLKQNKTNHGHKIWSLVSCLCLQQARGLKASVAHLYASASTPPPPPPTPIDSATEMLDGGGRLENRVKTSDWYRCLFHCTEHRSSPLLASAAKRISRMETAIETYFQLKLITPTSQSLWKRHVFILSLENITCKFSVQRWKVRNGWAISKWW